MPGHEWAGTGLGQRDNEPCRRWVLAVSEEPREGCGGPTKCSVGQLGWGPFVSKRAHQWGRRLSFSFFKAKLMDSTASTAMVDLSQATEDDATPEDRGTREICYGTTHVEIVGCQYYSGVVHDGEMVQLIREPRNPYDSNAIRVDNLTGAKVGHVKRTQAFALAPLLDVETRDPARALTALSCLVPFGNSGFKYSLSASLTLYGLPENVEWTASVLKRGKLKLTRGALAGSNPTAAAAKLVATRMSAYSAPNTQAELDSHFEAMNRARASLQGDSTSDELVAAGLLATPLLPHQRVGVAWMRSMERRTTGGGATPLPPLWEERLEQGRKVYFCTATNSSTVERPVKQLGGLLADDMGLGKVNSKSPTFGGGLSR